MVDVALIGRLAGYLAQVAEQPTAGQAQARGVQVEGICLYPVLDYPGWENGRTCEVGLLGIAPESAATAEWVMAPTQTVGYNGYPSVRLSGDTKPGFSSGDAIAEMEHCAKLGLDVSRYS